jgi:hypothetical protein
MLTILKVPLLKASNSKTHMSPFIMMVQRGGLGDTLGRGVGMVGDSKGIFSKSCGMVVQNDAAISSVSLGLAVSSSSLTGRILGDNGRCSERR